MNLALIFDSDIKIVKCSQLEFSLLFYLCVRYFNIMVIGPSGVQFRE